MVEVTDAEAVAAQPELAWTDGVFAEVSSAVVLVAVRKLAAAGEIGRSSTVVGVVTGSGYREMGAAAQTQKVEFGHFSVRDALSLLES